jgi:hypothetical protein
LIVALSSSFLLTLNLSNVNSFGGSSESFPHPDLDWTGFKAAINDANTRTPKVWCPIYRKLRSWISVFQVGLMRQGVGCQCDIS